MLDQSLSNTLPLISVIVPTYNSGRFIAQAVQSVLDQTYKQREIIVIDDGSMDATADILRGFRHRIQYCYQENHGPSAARNAGIKIAKGDYICFLDADDTWEPNKLEAQLAFIAQHDDVSLVFSDMEEMGLEKVSSESLLARMSFQSDLISQIPIDHAFVKLFIENFIITSTVLVKKECFIKAGLFDESLQVAEDRDMWLRIAAYFNIGCVPLILGKKRAHQRNISSNSELTLRSRLRVWENARRSFPHLVSITVLHRLLADTHLQLGYAALAKEHLKEARQHGWKSIVYALKRLIMIKTLDRLFPSYRWIWSVSLIMFTYIGWQKTQALLQIKNILLHRKVP